MSTIPRRLVATLAVAAAFAALSASAIAAPTMPATNPTDYKGLAATGAAWEGNVTIPAAKLGDAPYTTTVGNGIPGGVSATVTVARARVNNMTMLQTVTVKPTKVGQVTSTITNAFATLSGGNYGSTVIRSTKLNPTGKSFTTVLWFDEQGANSDLNLKFFLYHS